MIDDVRDVLRRREALLVHFNTPMSGHDEGYPQDLRDALYNPQWEMCYSTVLKSDVGPAQMADPSKAAACGSVGVLVDLGPESVILKVHHSDGGSSGRTWGAGLGSAPSPAACESGIQDRVDGHNEWYLSRSRPLGIFSFLHPAVFVPGDGERNRDIGSVVRDFPDQRIFTIIDGQFHELDREIGRWLPRRYLEIVPNTTLADWFQGGRLRSASQCGHRRGGGRLR